MELLGDVGELEARFVHLEIVLILASDGCTVCPNLPRARKSSWPHPMDLQGDVGQMKVCFHPHEDSVNLHARLVPVLRGACNSPKNPFRHTRWNS
jgi:hypothetical protein